MHIHTQGLIPEQGQLVRIRHRHFIVRDVEAKSTSPKFPPQHKLKLEALDDDSLGEELELIWEHEVNPRVHNALSLPRPEDWDPLERFEAFLLATRWSLTSRLAGLPLQAPFRGAIQIEDYQLEAVIRSMQMPRVNLLIADDVGLGKTIEAAMVMQEMLARQRIRKILVICPASLQRQWAEELESKFALHFEIVDRAYAQQLRREYGHHVNPWASYPRLITSMDFLKQERPLAAFLASLRRGDQKSLRDWDMLVIDEAHNVAPSGRKSYVRDSDRTHMVRQILSHFEHRLFLTATPHNGYTESFTALLEMLDPLRFSRGPVLDKGHLKAVMVRHVKDEIEDALGRRRFAKRVVEALPPVELNKTEAELFGKLEAYEQMRLSRMGAKDKLAVRFALTLLKKRLLSSPFAFAHSIAVHQSHLAPGEADSENAEDEAVVASLQKRLNEDFSDDEEKDRTEDTAIAETAFFFEANDAERTLVDELVQLSAAAAEGTDSKLRILLDWIEEHMREGEGFNAERLILFTEYRASMAYLLREFEKRGWSDAVLTLYGGMQSKEREAVKAAFQSDPAEDPVRILVATDAAAEGLNLQKHCRHLVHWEIPWNPNRMEQRNGRIDRHGQKAKEVFCRHFVFAGYEDQKFLDVVVDKVRTQRADLGSVGDVIAVQVEEALRGERQSIETPSDRSARMRDELAADRITKERILKLQQAVDSAREDWHLEPDRQRAVLHEALRLVGHPGLEAVNTEKGFYWLKNLPAAWADCRASIQDEKGRLVTLVFDASLMDGRKGLRLLHLDHPLMRRAMAVFRANLWSVGLHDSHKLQRCSYRVLPRAKLPQPVLILVSRLVATNVLGQKLHEEFLICGGQINKQELLEMPADKLDRLLNTDGEHPPLDIETAQALRRYFPSHELTLTGLMAAQARERAAWVEEEMERLKSEESEGVRALIDQRGKEIAARIKQMEKAQKSAQVEMFDLQEKEQYQRDLVWLRARQEELKTERKSEPEAIARRYALRGSQKTFPLALLYLLPDSLLKGGH